MSRPVPDLDSLREEYGRLFTSAVIPPVWVPAVTAVGRRAIANRARYEAVGAGIPWWWIAAIHNLEASCAWDKHLHNGDSLKRRTVLVPAGRPASGAPPFTWEFSARDALQIKGLDTWRDWSIPAALYQAERYNGWGYRRFHPKVLSPYLWSGTQHYTRGKYVADGEWSDTAASKQVGAAALWVWMSNEGVPLR